MTADLQWDLIRDEKSGGEEKRKLMYGMTSDDGKPPIGGS